ncbi:MAG: glycerophosphodiester phosphodiesterase [Actinomyces sp.]|uniref:glycerophosphodiester phosphodiesterase n=1 Tax=Actinomyces sp. TaxID=29317 RepID=UPI0026DB14BD|nr:glycerophosphodiester phosphodiesterase [Actinomyces sp.]MDO4242269.1 glycerophosphodiester phosphodiesterase [Actinomyces sp.]
MTNDSNGWLPPSEEGSAAQEETAPRYGAYGQPPAGQFDDPARQYGEAGSYGLATDGFSLAPKPGIVPLRPLGVMEIISAAFEALRANPRAMLLPALLVMTLTGVISAVTSYTMAAAQSSSITAWIEDSGDSSVPLGALLGGPSGLVGTAVASALIWLASTILTGVLIVAVSRSVLGRIATPSELWRRTRSRIWALIGQTLLVGVLNSLAIIVVAGVVGLVGYLLISSTEPTSTGALALALVAGFLLILVALVACLFLTTRLWLSGCALILENLSVWAGIARSWSLTRHHFWRVLGIFVLTSLITMAAVTVFSSVIGGISGALLLASPNGMALHLALSDLFASLSQAAVLPFTAAVTALTYIDLRMRDEGLDVELRQAADA